MFSYFGAIASYIVIAIPIFAGVYDSLDEPALAEGTVDCIRYLLKALLFLLLEQYLYSITILYL